MTPRRLHLAKLAVGGVLAILFLATLLGLLYMGALKVSRDAEREAEGTRVVVAVATPDGALFEGEVRARTPLEAIEAAGRASGFEVARTADGGSLLAAAGRAHGEGGRWSYAVASGGETRPSPGPEGRVSLEAGDRVEWTWTPA